MIPQPQTQPTTYTARPSDDIWHGCDVISTYTRQQAIEDGVLVDANIGDFADVTRQHYKYPVAMTCGVFSLIRRAVKNPRQCNDYKGVWHDICWMSKHGIISRPDPTTVVFQVIITGAARQRLWTLKAVCGPGDHAEPVVTIMFPNED